MEYCLSNLRHTEQWPLEADTYKHMLKCKERVIAWLRVEEVFGYVIDSWCDMEAAIHARTLRSHASSANQFLTRASRFDDRATADRLMLGYLSASRMYLDHMRKQMPVITGDDQDIAKKTESLRNTYRDRDAAFLIADELRNLVIHEDLGVKTVTYGVSLLDKPTAQATIESTISLPMKDLSPLISALRNKLTAATQKSSQARIQRLKDEIAVLESYPVPCELRGIMRHSCATLASMHDELRQIVRSSVDEAIRLFEEAYDRERHDDHGEYGVFACEIAGDGKCRTCEWIGSAVVERLTYLRDKYSGWERVRDHVHGTPA